jgi:hypothetical protein
MTPLGEHVNSLDCFKKVLDQRPRMHFVALPKNGGAVFSKTPEGSCQKQVPSGS